jgi:pimeloyl-ACP methyl ester carboxylesterase
MTELFADANGIKLSYEIHGKEDNRPIILIHGIGAKKSIWITQIPSLIEKYRVITYDVRGFGKSDRPNEPYTMELWAEDLCGLMDYLNISKSVIGGRSMGGMIAQNFALKYPERVTKIILITTNPGMPDKQGAEMMKRSRLAGLELLQKDPFKAYWNNTKVLYAPEFRKEMERDPEKMFYGLWSPREQIKESMIDPPTSQDIENQSNAIQSHYTLDRLHLIKQQTLLIAASRDRFTPLSTMIEMHNKLPNSVLKVIENAGHYCTLSRATEVNQIILDFLEE